MLPAIAALLSQFSLLCKRWLARLGFRPETFLLLLAVLIGVVAAVAAVTFHEFIRFLRAALYARLGPRLDLYGRGLVYLVILPTVGGLAVGLLTRYVFRIRAGQGIVDVLEAVIRSRGVIKPLSALEKIITSAITIGSGGSAGAEGPIVQIGAGIASGVGQLFRVARPHMPLLIGCGSAAGISAIFNSPLGGVLFTLEVVLLDFSLRTFAPVVLASVVANVTTKAIFAALHHGQYQAIFQIPSWQAAAHPQLSWTRAGDFILLGLLCGAIGVALIRFMQLSERWFASLRMPATLKPAFGGAILGVLGVAYILAMGWGMLGDPKPIAVQQYPLPAFYSDGYGVIRQLVMSAPAAEDAEEAEEAAAERPAGPETRPANVPVNAFGFYASLPWPKLILLLALLIPLKLLATAATLGSGGSGGIIAPSLFLGAVAGGLLGLLLSRLGVTVPPNFYALIGMGAVLAAVVHAPLASILILGDLANDHTVILPGMLACIVSTGFARLLYRDSIYSAPLRMRGVRVGRGGDVSLLRRLTVEQVELEPVVVVSRHDSLRKLLDMADLTESTHLVVCDDAGAYLGLVVTQDVATAMATHELGEALLVGDVMRPEAPMVSAADDLASVLDAFALHDSERLPVRLGPASHRPIGLISRVGLLRRYQKELGER